MSISYWFLLQSKYGIVPNRGTSKIFVLFSPLQPDRGLSIIKKWATVHIL